METQVLSEHKVALAKEVLDDVELGRLSLENLLLKATRLARITDNTEIRTWLGYEMLGYVSNEKVSLKYMNWTGRWTDESKGLGYWQGLAALDSQITAYQMELKQLQIPNVNVSFSSANPNEVVTGYTAFGTSPVQQATAAINNVMNRMATLAQSIGIFSSIKSKALFLLHRSISNTFYELTFSGLQETIFEHQKARIDSLLAKECGEVLEKVPAIYDRLASGDAEAVSQALNTCRRMIDTFADKIYPPTDGAITIDGNELNLSATHHKNRINAYVHQSCPSESLKRRTKKRLDLLYERVSTGVHADISPQEAQFLFLDTYLLLGEIVALSNQQQAVS